MWLSILWSHSAVSAGSVHSFSLDKLLSWTVLPPTVTFDVIGAFFAIYESTEAIVPVNLAVISIKDYIASS